MSFGVMAGSLGLEKSLLWQMCMHLVMVGRNKGCGTRFQCGFNRWGG
ncbi:hypothetical protein A2U01_0101465, partial [Trifolium medium]|nr:hypothetical protein [Trifolium medium]